MLVVIQKFLANLIYGVAQGEKKETTTNSINPEH